MPLVFLEKYSPNSLTSNSGVDSTENGYLGVGVHFGEGKLAESQNLTLVQLGKLKE